jgi:putative flippase GtrA
MLTARYVFHAPVSLINYGWFLSAALLGFAINVGVTLYVSLILGVWAPLAKTVGVGIAFFANFALNSLLVFRRSQGRHRPTS